MSQKLDVEDLDLSDAELIKVLKNHGMSRRILMKVFGAGAVITALGGTAAGSKGKGTRIDDVFGAPYSKDEEPPSGIVDHVVGLHVHAGDATFEGFPVGDGDDPDDQDDAPEFHFDPVGLHVKPGDVVHFDNHAHEHTVSAFHDKWNPIFPNRVPDGVPGFTSPPYVGDEDWLYRFKTKGVYDMFCFPHVPLGMVMRVVVFDPEEDDITDDKFVDHGGFAHPALANAEAVLTDDELDPDNIVTAGEVAWGDLSL